MTESGPRVFAEAWPKLANAWFAEYSARLGPNRQMLSSRLQIRQVNQFRPKSSQTLANLPSGVCGERTRFPRQPKAAWGLGMKLVASVGGTLRDLRACFAQQLVRNFPETELSMPSSASPRMPPSKANKRPRDQETNQPRLRRFGEGCGLAEGQSSALARDNGASVRRAPPPGRRLWELWPCRSSPFGRTGRRAYRGSSPTATTPPPHFCSRGILRFVAPPSFGNECSMSPRNASRTLPNSGQARSTTPTSRVPRERPRPPGRPRSRPRPPTDATREMRWMRRRHAPVPEGEPRKPSLRGEEGEHDMSDADEPQALCKEAAHTPVTLIARVRPSAAIRLPPHVCQNPSDQRRAGPTRGGKLPLLKRHKCPMQPAMRMMEPAAWTPSSISKAARFSLHNERGRDTDAVHTCV